MTKTDADNNWQPYSGGYRLRSGSAWLLRSSRGWSLIVDELEIEREFFAPIEESVDIVFGKANRLIDAIAKQRISRLKELKDLVKF